MGCEGWWRLVKVGGGQSLSGTESQVEGFGAPLLLGQHLRGLYDRSPFRDGPAVGFPGAEVPAAGGAVERMRRGPQADVRPARPVGRVVARPQSVARGVRDFVELIAVGRQPSVREEVFFRIALVVRCAR